uniref:hypothetical protein n=1 Tax=uncultured Alistipes sp. TaxID=538949 RepID=UPI002648425E
KAVELPVCKAGKKMSGANKAKLDEICQALSDFKSAFDEDPDEKEEEDTTKKKEDNSMTKAEIQAEVNAAVVKALTEADVIKAAPAGAEPQTPPQAQAQPTTPVEKAAEPAQVLTGVDFEATVAKAAEAAVKKTLIEAGLIEEEADPNAPVTKGEVQQIVTDALAPMLKAFSLPQNLNNEGQVAKSDEQHYLYGLL